MKNALLRLALLTLTLTGSVQAFGQNKEASLKKTDQSPLSTDIKFSGSEVQGKYQVPVDSVINVEKEKDLMPLIAPRYHFKDRLLRAQGRR